MVTRPGESASSAEIARWMEEDFWESIAESTEDGVDESSMEE
jgi:hypothetical protein